MLPMNSARICLLLAPLFCAVVKAAPVKNINITATEGDNVTLWSEKGNYMHVLLTRNSTRLLSTDQEEEMIGNIDYKHGVIILLNAMKENSSTYELQIVGSDSETRNFIIRLNVTERQPQAPEPSLAPRPPSTSAAPEAQRSHLFTFIALIPVLCCAALVLFRIRRRKSRRSQTLQINYLPARTSPGLNQDHSRLNGA